MSRRNGRGDGHIGGTSRPADGLGGHVSRFGGPGSFTRRGPILAVRAVVTTTLETRGGDRELESVVAVEALGALTAEEQDERVKELRALWAKTFPGCVVEVER